MERINVFVYGTLMNRRGNHRLLHNSNFLGDGHIDGFAIYNVTGSFPGVIRLPRARVTGEVYEITEEELARLDHLESNGFLYKRERCLVKMANDEIQNAWVYLWLNEVKEETRMCDDCKWGEEDSFYLLGYGRFCNVEEMRKLYRKNRIYDEPNVIGVAELAGYKLAFNRLKSDQTGALDVVESEDSVWGMLYRLPGETRKVMRSQEGYPFCYSEEMRTVVCGEKKYQAIVYEVVDKNNTEVAPDKEYFNAVYEGMKATFPESYYMGFVKHCEDEFGLSYIDRDLFDMEKDVLRVLRREPSKVEMYMVANYIGRSRKEAIGAINQLLKREYIKQDRRDDINKQADFNTYYTVKEKREEIDNILEVERVQTVIDLADLDCFLSGQDEVSYVCLKCNTIYNKHSKVCMTQNCCKGNVIKLDVRMIDIIMGLNQKGYETEHCCSGHLRSVVGRSSIMFKDNHDELYPPEMFEINHKNGKTTIRSKDYYKRIGIKSNGNLTAEDFLGIKELIDEDNKALREWGYGLIPRI